MTLAEDLVQYGPKAYLFALETYNESELSDIINNRFNEAFTQEYSSHNVYGFVSPNYKNLIGEALPEPLTAEANRYVSREKVLKNVPNNNPKYNLIDMIFLTGIPTGGGFTMGNWLAVGAEMDTFTKQREITSSPQIYFPHITWDSKEKYKKVNPTTHFYVKHLGNNTKLIEHTWFNPVKSLNC